MADKTLQELHEEGINETLRRLVAADKAARGGLGANIPAYAHPVLVTQDTLRSLLNELFHLRWQNRQLQARGTELLNERRDLAAEHRALQGRFKKLQDFSDEQQAEIAALREGSS